VVAKLEQLLEEAKAGQFNGLAFATVTSPHTGSYTEVGTGWEGAGVLQNSHTAVGAVSGLHYRMMRDLLSWEPHQ
jgi:hypothetical protein